MIFPQQLLQPPGGTWILGRDGTLVWPGGVDPFTQFRVPKATGEEGPVCYGESAQIATLQAVITTQNVQ